MVLPDRDLLSGEVEVDESYLGGEEPGARGRRTINRAIVFIAAENKGRKIGRIRLRRTLDLTSKSLQGFIVDVVRPGSLIHTDGWQGYASIGKKGFSHRVTVTRTASEPAHIPFPGVHRVASLLKRWCLGTHQGAISKDHLNYYLDEFTFRFNRRTLTFPDFSDTGVTNDSRRRESVKCSDPASSVAPLYGEAEGR